MIQDIDLGSCSPLQFLLAATKNFGKFLALLTTRPHGCPVRMHKLSPPVEQQVRKGDPQADLSAQTFTDQATSSRRHSGFHDNFKFQLSECLPGNVGYFTGSLRTVSRHARPLLFPAIPGQDSQSGPTTRPADPFANPTNPAADS